MGYIGTFRAFIGHSGSSWVHWRIQSIHRAFDSGSSWVSAFSERYGSSRIGAFIAHWYIREFMGVCAFKVHNGRRICLQGSGSARRSSPHYRCSCSASTSCGMVGTFVMQDVRSF